MVTSLACIGMPSLLDQELLTRLQLTLIQGQETGAETLPNHLPLPLLRATALPHRLNGEYCLLFEAAHLTESLPG